MDEVARKNQEGWNTLTYKAWVKGKGSPAEFAAKLMSDPWGKLQPYREHLGELEGKRVANLLGSNGRVAVALALLGADVTVVDISEENAQYGCELAQAAGVKIHYVVSDVMSIPSDQQIVDRDIVLMELGILHWIMDLKAFFAIVSRMVKPGGRLILRDFHPVKRGLLTWDGSQMVASRDYFDDSIQEGDAPPYAIFLSEDERQQLTKVYTRGWTMGEIITATAEAGFIIKILHEERGKIQRWVFPEEAPEGIEDRIPGIYTLVADKG